MFFRPEAKEGTAPLRPTNVNIGIVTRTNELFAEYKGFFEDFYLHHEWKNLSQLNQHLITEISRKFLNLKVAFENSFDYQPQGTRLDRLMDVLKKVGATEYISGPAARSYISEEYFSKENIKLTWMDYSNYPEYRQHFPPFVHDVSIIDLIFNEGADSIHYLSPVKSK